MSFEITVSPFGSMALYASCNVCSLLFEVHIPHHFPIGIRCCRCSAICTRLPLSCILASCHLITKAEHFGRLINDHAQPLIRADGNLIADTQTYRGILAIGDCTATTKGLCGFCLKSNKLCALRGTAVLAYDIEGSIPDDGVTSNSENVREKLEFPS